MKTLLLSSLAVLSFSALAQTRECSIQDIQKLNNASGNKSAAVQELLSLETPNFSCLVTPKNFMFPQDCGRFVFTELRYEVVVGASKMIAVVQDGKISCTAARKTTLKSVSISE
jgi:hypothetical protein